MFMNRRGQKQKDNKVFCDNCGNEITNKVIKDGSRKCCSIECLEEK